MVEDGHWLLSSVVGLCSFAEEEVAYEFYGGLYFHSVGRSVSSRSVAALAAINKEEELLAVCLFDWLVGWSSPPSVSRANKRICFSLFSLFLFFVAICLSLFFFVLSVCFFLPIFSLYL